MHYAREGSSPSTSGRAISSAQFVDRTEPEKPHQQFSGGSDSTGAVWGRGAARHGEAENSDWCGDRRDRGAAVAAGVAVMGCV